MHVSQSRNSIPYAWWEVIRLIPLEWNLYNTLKPRKNGRHLKHFQVYFFIEKVRIFLQISMKFVHKGAKGLI